MLVNLLHIEFWTTVLQRVYVLSNQSALWLKQGSLTLLLGSYRPLEFSSNLNLTVCRSRAGDPWSIQYECNLNIHLPCCCYLVTNGISCIAPVIPLPWTSGIERDSEIPAEVVNRPSISHVLFQVQRTLFRTKTEVRHCTVVSNGRSAVLMNGTENSVSRSVIKTLKNMNYHPTVPSPGLVFYFILFKLKINLLVIYKVIHKCIKVELHYMYTCSSPHEGFTSSNTIMKPKWGEKACSPSPIWKDPHYWRLHST